LDKMEKSLFKKPLSLVDQLKYELKNAIVKGRLLPGQQIREIELQQWFKVSRAPIREAIRLLEAEGLIAINSYKKKFIRRITRNDLDQMFPVMAVLEGLAARITSQLINDKMIKKLIYINNELKEANENKDYDLCAELNYQFHNIYIRKANNSAIETAIRGIERGTIWLWLTNIYYTVDKVVNASINDHNKVIDAFKKKDAKKAEILVREHILNVNKRSHKFHIYDKKGELLLKEK